MPVAPATGRRIAALAFPALGVLAAEPIYLLFDIAVVGRLGALPLAGLAIGGLILSTLSSQMTFLSYGTTARSARFFGAGNRTSAVGEGVQATWLALGLGTLIVVVVEAAAVPLVSALAAGGDIATTALPWVRIAIVGVPAILVSPWVPRSAVVPKERIFEHASIPNTVVAHFNIDYPDRTDREKASSTFLDLLSLDDIRQDGFLFSDK